MVGNLAVSVLSNQSLEEFQAGVAICRHQMMPGVPQTYMNATRNDIVNWDAGPCPIGELYMPKSSFRPESINPKAACLSLFAAATADAVSAWRLIHRAALVVRRQSV
jgi:hypothetical protein